MNDEKKTKKQLIEELVLLRREISKLKASKAGGSATKSGKQGTKEDQYTYRELLMRTFANLPDALFIVGAERAEIIDCNPAASNIFGYTRREMLGRTTTFLHSGQTGLEEFRRHLYPAVSEKRYLFLPKFTMKRKNGEVFSTEHTVIPFRDEGEGAIGWVSVVRDITNRKRAEDEIRRLSEQLSLILDSLPVALFMVNLEDDYAATYVSPNIKAITGFESTDFTARASFWFERTHPEDVPKIMGDLPQLFENGHRQYEYRFRVANDTYRWFNERVRLTKSSDGTPYVVGIMEDITQRKQADEGLRESEERYRALAESAQDFIFIVGKDGNVQYVNTSGAKAFGSRPEEIIGRNISELFAPERLEIQMKQIRQVCESGKSANDEHINRFPKRTLWLNTLLVPLRNEAGEINSVIGVSRDITQFKKVEEALRESEERYRALAELAQDFIFIVDKDGYVRYVNNFAANEFGCRQEEMVGKRIHELFPPDLVKHQIENIQNICKSGLWVDREFRTVFPGRTLWLDTSLVPLKDETGEINSVIGISRDITARKEMEENLKKSEILTCQLAEENKIIAEIGRIISSTLNIQEIYELFAEAVRKLLPFDRISVVLYNLQDKTIRVAHLAGMEIATVRVGRITPLTKSVSEQLLERRSGMIIRLESEEEILERFPNILANYRAGIRSRVSVPLISKDEVIGGLHVESLKSNAYTEEHLSLLERVGIQISGAVANAKLFAERKQVEERLRDSEEQYRLLVENAPLGICLTQGSRLIFANTRMSKRLGYSNKELTSRSFLEFLHPDDRGIIAEYLKKRSEGEPTPKSYRVRVVHKDGSVSWRRVDVTLLPSKDQSSQLNFLTDITEEVKKEEELSSYRAHLEELIKERTIKLEASKDALIRSDRRYQEIIEIAQEGVWMTDVSGKTSYVNHRMAAMLGYPAAEMLSRPVSEFMAPEGRFIWDQLLRRCSAGIKDRHDLLLKAKEDKDIWVMVSSAPRYDEEGRFSGALLMVTDISERKEAVEKIVTSKKMLQRVFDGIAEPLIMMDKDFVVRMLNETARDYYQMESYQQIIGKPLSQDFLESDEAGRKVRAAVIEGRVLTFERRSPSDPSRFERVIIYPLQENEGILGDAIIRISDITEARLLQREVIQNEKLASLGLLVSSIAHEINNPNNFISFNIPILRDYLQEVQPILDDYSNQHPDHELFGMDYHEFRQDISKLLSNIEHGATRINTVVSNLRDFSRKRDQQAWRWVHLREVVEKGVAICTGELRKKVKSVEINVSDDLPMVLTDPEALEQILVNLLINAIQATDKEDSWIKVRAMLAPSGTDDVIIEVSDNGCGMDNNTLDRIFEPFFTTKPPGTGTGLGLYVSQNVIDELEGDIAVESQLRIGSTFRIRIPIEKKGERSFVDSTS